jgi:hypothetical protein
MPEEGRAWASMAGDSAKRKAKPSWIHISPIFFD